MKYITIIFLFVLLMVATPAYAGQGEDTVENLVKILITWNGTDQSAYSEAAKYIDYRVMSERVLGQEHWHNLSSSQKNEFVDAFQHLIEKRYYPRWHRLFRNGHIEYLNEQEVHGDTLVRTQLKIGDSSKNTNWTLTKANGEYKVISLQVNGRDLVTRAGRRFQKKLATCEFKDFLAWIKNQSVHSLSDNTANNGKTF